GLDWMTSEFLIEKSGKIPSFSQIPSCLSILGLPPFWRNDDYGRQWKRPRTRSRELLKLKVPKRQALRVGLSRKGSWKLSKTLSTNRGLTHLYLQKQGLVSIRQLWLKCHYPATAR
ncbi:hypothetical protein WDW89_22135, partial [Deltaproteobacteria bacterium TL4]